MFKMLLAQRVEIPLPEHEHAFAKHLGRRFRFDLAWPDVGLAVELEGGLYGGKGHGKRDSYLKDLEKYNLAAELGWTVLRYSYGTNPLRKEPPVSLLSEESLAQVCATYHSLEASLRLLGHTSFSPRR